MEQRLRLSLKMLFLILSTSIVIYVLAIGLISVKYKKTALEDAKALTNSYVKQYAFLIKTSLDADMDVVRALAQAFHGYEDLEQNSRRALYNKMLKSVLEKNKQYVSVWDSWELQFIDSSWNKTHGRLSTAFYRKNNLIDITIDSLDLYDDNVSSTYYKIKISGRETITDPYFYSYTKQKIDEILETSLVSTIVLNNNFIGITGVDVSLEHFKNIIDTIHPFKGSYTFLLANNGSFVAHPNRNYSGRIITNVFPEYAEKAPVLENVKNGESFNFIISDQHNNENYYFSFSPIRIGKTRTPWSFGIVVPLQSIMEEANSHFLISVRVGLLGLLILTFIIWFIATNIAKPLRKTTKALRKLSLGDISKSDLADSGTNDEIGAMSSSVNNLIINLEKTANFADEIGKRNFNKEFTLLSDNDALGKAILEMRNSLRVANQEEIKSKKNEQNLIWHSNGLNIFSRILREDNNDINKLCFNIIKILVSYLNANEGGIYLVHNISEESKILKLTAFIGFEKEKYNIEEVPFGEGLVGRCAVEKDKIFITDVVDDYIKISSGLGREKPNSILLVPLIYNDDLIGVVELESFIIFEDHQISFLEKISEISAATISSAKINIRTTELLEQSQLQADELAQQEEEMRQNMEEMQATQEEASKKEEEISSLISALNSALYVTMYDTNGIVIDINNNLVELLNTQKDRIIGKKHLSILFKNDKNNERFSSFWNNLREGKSKTEIEFYRIGRKEIWLSEKYTPIIDNEGNTIKVIKISTNISEVYNLEEEIIELQQQKAKAQKKHQDVLAKEQLERDKKDSKLVIEKLLEEINFEYVNLTYLNKVFKGDISKIQHILDVYLKTIPEQIDELFNINNNKNWDLLKLKATNFKSKMNYLGLDNLVDLSKKIIHITTTKQNFLELSIIINSIEDIWMKIEKEIKKIKKSKNLSS
ncbi:MAG: GAF domain-containing protein [Bacteroidales bacterium]|nr:GAF domain-containing protein [Bacteroidales bacterium]